MKLRLPLLPRILLWFFLNLALLAAGFILLVRSQFVFDRDFLLTAGAVEHLQTIGDEIAAEMSNRPLEQWKSMLDQYDNTYKVRFHVFSDEGRPLVGDPQRLPPEVHERLARRPGPQRRPPPEAMGEPGNLPPQDSPPERRPPPPVGRNPNPPRMLIRAGNPPHYWFIVRASTGVFVVVESETLTGRGLFLDLRPWLVAVFGAAIFSALFWVPIVRGITRSIAQMTQATQQIAEGHFDVRVEAHRGDELGTLSQAINSMAQRLDGFVTGQKRFLGDVAHELCSPLARLRLALGILEERVSGSQQSDVSRASEQADEIAALVNELLSFSKATLGAAHAKLQQVPLRAIVDLAVRREGSDGARIEVNMASDLRAEVEPELLTRALSNLLRNAIRYAGPAGPITISVEQHDGQVALTVSDCGPGIPETELQRIFDPFYRLDASRDRETGGVGLGLAIVKTCVEACQGTVVAANRLPNGLQVTITLRMA
ncbi:MAG TPA: HAMP domain-containing sensor histidine kinase [Verrucomicrobiae bacterium]|nr:HAMP domain-containing sensor histidine kinase [Verrucomicrobiae bacterium]